MEFRSTQLWGGQCVTNNFNLMINDRTEAPQKSKDVPSPSPDPQAERHFGDSDPFIRWQKVINLSCWVSY